MTDRQRQTYLLVAQVLGQLLLQLAQLHLAPANDNKEPGQ